VNISFRGGEVAVAGEISQRVRVHGEARVVEGVKREGRQSREFSRFRMFLLQRRLFDVNRSWCLRGKPTRQRTRFPVASL